MRLLISLIMMTCLAVSAAEKKKELTAEEKKEIEKLVKEFGIYGKEFKSGKDYKKLTFQGLKAGKKEMKNKKVQYEGIYKGFNDNFPRYVEDSGYSGKRYHYLLINGYDIPVMARRKKDILELLGKIKKGVKVIVYGRVKEFRKDPMHGMMPRYCIELAHIQVLAIEPDGAAGNDNEEGNDAWKEAIKNRRPPRRRR